MPNGPDQRLWMYSEGQRKVDLIRQELADVREAADSANFCAVISAAAAEGMQLHSWNIACDGRIIAVFSPASDEALDRQRKKKSKTMEQRISPEVFHKALSRPLPENLRRLLTILYNTDGYVPDSEIQKELGKEPKGVGGVMAWVKIYLSEEGAKDVKRDDFFQWKEPIDEGGYRLRDHLRPVVAKLLNLESEH